MKFQNNQKLILGFTIIVIVALILSPMLSVGGITPIASGATVVSLSQFDYSTNGEDFSKEFRANVLIGQGGNYLQGIENTNGFQTAKSSDGKVSSTQKFKVNFDLDSMNAQYGTIFGQSLSKLVLEQKRDISQSISLWDNNGFREACKVSTVIGATYKSKQVASDNGNGQPVYVDVFTNDYCVADYEKICENAGYVVLKADNWAYGFLQTNLEKGRACVKVVASGTPMYYTQIPSSKSIQFSSKVNIIKEDGSSESLIINSVDQTSARSSNGNVVAYFTQYGLTAKDMIPEYSNFYYLQGNGGNPSGAVTRTFFDSAGSGLGALRTQAVTVQKYDELMGQYGSGALPEIISYNALLSTVSSQFDNSFTFSNGVVKKDFSQNLPASINLLLHIRAEWLGVVDRCTIPSFSSVVPQTIPLTSGQSATATFTVTNLGDEGGITVFTPVCSSGVTPSLISDPSGSFSTNQPKSGTIKVQASGQGIANCSIKAESSCAAATVNSDTELFYVDVKPQCTNPCEGTGRVRATDGSCDCICLIDPQFCIDRGLVKADGCACREKTCADTNTCTCEQTNTCPPTKCSDGTLIDACNYLAVKRCKLVGSSASLVEDITCLQCKDNEVKDNGTCKVNCTSTKVLVNGECICPTGAVLNKEGQCVQDNSWFYIIGGIVLVLVLGYVAYKEKWF